MQTSDTLMLPVPRTFLRMLTKLHSLPTLENAAETAAWGTVSLSNSSDSARGKCSRAHLQFKLKYIVARLDGELLGTPR